MITTEVVFTVISHLRVFADITMVANKTHVRHHSHRHSLLCTPRRNNDTVASLLTRDLAPSCLKMWKAETELVYKGASTLFLDAKGAATLSKRRATANR